VRPVPVDPTGATGPTKSQATRQQWRRTSLGLYVPATVDRTRVEQRILEEAGRLPVTGAVTGWAALRLHGVGYADGLEGGRSERPVPLVVPPGVALRAAPGIQVHRERIADVEISMVCGIPVAIAERAAFDAAKWEVDVRARVAVLDMALAAGAIRLGTFQAYVNSRKGLRGAGRVAEALVLCDGRSMSPKETALRLIWVLDALLPAPRCNWPVADERGAFIGRPDLLSNELAVIGEFDGAHHRQRDRQRDDVRRDDAFRAAGLEPFRIVGAYLSDVRLVLRRIEAAVQRARTSTVPRTWMASARPGPV
jgi:hypothetical protein